MGRIHGVYVIEDLASSGSPVACCLTWGTPGTGQKGPREENEDKNRVQKFLHGKFASLLIENPSLLLLRVAPNLSDSVPFSTIRKVKSQKPGIKTQAI
jgi:hypothetical protein